MEALDLNRALIALAILRITELGITQAWLSEVSAPTLDSRAIIAKIAQVKLTDPNKWEYAWERAARMSGVTINFGP